MGRSQVTEHRQYVTCSDCGTRRLMKTTEWNKAARPRCYACGGPVHVSTGDRKGIVKRSKSYKLNREMRLWVKEQLKNRLAKQVAIPAPMTVLPRNKNLAFSGSANSLEPGEQAPTVFECLVRSGHDQDWDTAKLGNPTDAFPGSDEKIEIMCQRVQAGEAVHHPDDLRVDRLKLPSWYSID